MQIFGVVRIAISGESVSREIFLLGGTIVRSRQLSSMTGQALLNPFFEVLDGKGGLQDCCATSKLASFLFLIGLIAGSGLVAV